MAAPAPSRLPREGICLGCDLITVNRKKDIANPAAPPSATGRRPRSAGASAGSCATTGTPRRVEWVDAPPDYERVPLSIEGTLPRGLKRAPAAATTRTRRSAPQQGQRGARQASREARPAQALGVDQADARNRRAQEARRRRGRRRGDVVSAPADPPAPATLPVPAAAARTCGCRSESAIRTMLCSLLRSLTLCGYIASPDQAQDTSVTVAFTYQGLKALGVPKASLDSFAPEFRQGMAAREAEWGDHGESGPRELGEAARHPGGPRRAGRPLSRRSAVGGQARPSTPGARRPSRGEGDLAPGLLPAPDRPDVLRLSGRDRATRGRREQGPGVQSTGAADQGRRVHPRLPRRDRRSSADAQPRQC